MTGTSGLISPTPYAFFDPDTCAWRTSQDISLLGSTGSSLILPRSGSMRNGRLWRRQVSVHRIDATVSTSLLPTPTEWLGRRPSHSVGDPERWANPERSRELSDCVAALALLPTPTAMDSVGSRNITAQRKPGAKYQPGTTLTDAAWILSGVATPSPSNGGNGSSDGPLQSQLWTDDSTPDCPNG